MKYTITSEDERKQQVESTMRQIELQHVHLKAMQAAGNFNTDPARGPVTMAAPPAWTRQGKTDEDLVDEEIQKLEGQHRKLNEVRRKLVAGEAV